MKEDWATDELGNIFHTSSGGTPSRRNDNYFKGSILWVKSGELDKGVIFNTEEKISEEAVKNSSAKIFPKGTLLIALYGATIGKLAFLGVDAATNQAICGIYKNDNIDSKFLYNFLLFRRPKLISQGAGGAQPNISQTILKKLEFSFPSKPEQRAIVQKIENLFALLDKGIADLKTAQEQLKIYRQAVLKKAFEGEFTNNVKENELPEGWKWVKLKEVCTKIQDGTHFSPKHQSTTRGGNTYPYITSKNIRNGFMDLSNITYVDEEFHNSIYNRCDPVFGDVLLTKDGVNTGNVTLNTFKEPISLLSSVCLIKPTESIVAKYIVYYIQSPNGFKNLTGDMTGTAIKRIILKKIKDTIVPLPKSLDEQHTIVREIESRLSVCDKVEENISESLEKAEALRQSILKNAFEGKLLSQEEITKCRQEADYEPASVLLERIRKENKHGK